MFCGEPEAEKHVQKMSLGIWGLYKDRKGRERMRETQRERQAGSVGHKKAFTVSLGESVEPRLSLCDWAKSSPGTRRKKRENPRFHMCANVLFGTLPAALLI